MTNSEDGGSAGSGGIGWDKAKSKHRHKLLMDRLSSATLFSSVSNVLEAFNQAKERITKATEGFDIDQNKDLNA